MLFRGDRLIHLPPKELAALRLFLAHPGQIITSQQLKQELWGDVHVTPDSIPKCVSSLRARLEPVDCIQTIYKRGYRFSGEVTLMDSQRGVLPRLAIMPFSIGYTVPEHLGLAVAEETTMRLANMPRPIVSVLARDSVFTLAERGLTAHQVGEALKADLVLAGSISCLTAHYRLRAEMIRVEDGTQIWVEDVLILKSRIAGLEAELSRRLNFRLGLEDVSFSTGQEGTSPQIREAYETFQRARYEWQTLQRHRMQDGLQHLSRATEMDPSLVAAKVDLVHLCVTQTFYGFMSPASAAELVHRTADSVPDLAGRAEAILPALGWVNFHYDHNLPAALWAFSLSEHLKHNPWNTRVRTMFELSRRHFPEAIEMLQEALHDDPYSPWLHNRLAWALHLAGLARESMDQVQQSILLFPGHEGTSLYGAAILAYNGEKQRAVELSRDLAQRLPYFDLATTIKAYALACAGLEDEARTILERLQWLSRERFVLKSLTPAAYVALGEYEIAISELRAAEANRCPWYFQTLADPRLAPLHTHPEFVEMCALLANMEAGADSDTQPQG